MPGKLHELQRLFLIEAAKYNVLPVDDDTAKKLNSDLAMQGLGLTSMREHIRMVSGAIAIESKPMSGTQILVRVPFDSARASERTAG